MSAETKVSEHLQEIAAEIESSQRIKELEEERDRLREALQEIAYHTQPSFKYVYGIATKALEETT